MGTASRISLVVVSLGALGSASCTAMLTPNQRQELETRTYQASVRDTFAATRDTVLNRGYQVKQSDFEGGVLTFERSQLRFSPKTALGLSILCPTAGDFYVERYGWGVFDAFLWPFSIVWAAPSNYLIAGSTYAALQGTVSFDALAPERTRIRVTLSGVPWDVETYPVGIRDLQEEVERQLFIREGTRLPLASP
jgi:hypothetical protein